MPPSQEIYVELDSESFDLASHHFISRYIKTELGCLRNQFIMDLHRDLTTGQSYISIDRPLHPKGDDLMDDLGFGALGVEDHAEDVFEKERMQDDDDCVMVDEGLSKEKQVKGRLDLDRIAYVHYEIHYHPTYRVPYLWFHMKNLPAGESCFDIDAVYRHLVPDYLKGPLREIGVQGGISAACHPTTGVPSFFMHPCNTAEVMRELNCSLEDYLLKWIGAVGQFVGLQLPLAMAIEDSTMH